MKSSDFINQLNRCDDTELDNFTELCVLLEKDLEHSVSVGRRAHIHGVRQACKFLGNRFQCNTQLLELAALMHDMAREMPSSQQLEILQDCLGGRGTKKSVGIRVRRHAVRDGVCKSDGECFG